MRAAVLVVVMLLAGCSDPQQIADEAMAGIATDLGKLTTEAAFSEVHVYDETVCGSIDGMRFISIRSGEARFGMLVEQEAPEAIKDASERTFISCMNKGKAVP